MPCTASAPGATHFDDVLFPGDRRGTSSMRCTRKRTLLHSKKRFVERDATREETRSVRQVKDVEEVEVRRSVYDRFVQTGNERCTGSVHCDSSSPSRRPLSMRMGDRGEPLGAYLRERVRYHGAVQKNGSLRWPQREQDMSFEPNRSFDMSISVDFRDDHANKSSRENVDRSSPRIQWPALMRPVVASEQKPKRLEDCTIWARCTYRAEKRGGQSVYTG
jgi:hypothetical protein